MVRLHLGTRTLRRSRVGGAVGEECVGNNGASLSIVDVSTRVGVCVIPTADSRLSTDMSYCAKIPKIIHFRIPSSKVAFKVASVKQPRQNSHVLLKSRIIIILPFPTFGLPPLMSLDQFRKIACLLSHSHKLVLQ